MPFRRPVFLLLILSLPLSSQAESSLAQAVNSAFDKARQAMLVESLKQQGDAIRHQAAGLIAGNPTLSLSHLSDWPDRDRGLAEWEAGVELPLWLPGQRDARNRVANATTDQAEALERLLRLKTAGSVRESVWALALANGRAALADDALDTARTLERSIDKKVQAGELARLELLLARQETSEAEIDRQKAHADREQALTRLRLLTGLEKAPTDYRETPATHGLTEHHPRRRLAAMKTARARAERDRGLVEKRENPSLSIGGKSQRDSRDQDYEQLLALEVRLPLGLSSQAAPRQAAAERELTRLLVEQHRIEAELEQEHAAARLELEASRDAVTLAEKRSAQASDALRLSRRAFELGETGLRQVIPALRSARQADLNLALRRIEQGRAVARFNQALGVIPR